MFGNSVSSGALTQCGKESALRVEFKQCSVIDRGKELVLHPLIVQKIERTLGSRKIPHLKKLGRDTLELILIQMLFCLPAKVILDRVCNIKKTIQQKWIEGAALALDDHLQCFPMGDGTLIHTLARQRIVHIRKSGHLRGDRDLLSYEPVRISAAIVALVMPETDLIGSLQKRLVLMEGKILQKLRTFFCMLLHDLELFPCQPPRLIEDRFRNSDLTDIMQRRSHADPSYIATTQLVSIRLLHKAAKQQLRQDPDMQNV